MSAATKRKSKISENTISLCMHKKIVASLHAAHDEELLAWTWAYLNKRRVWLRRIVEHAYGAPSPEWEVRDLPWRHVLAEEGTPTKAVVSAYRARGSMKKSSSWKMVDPLNLPERKKQTRKSYEEDFAHVDAFLRECNKLTERHCSRLVAAEKEYLGNANSDDQNR